LRKAESERKPARPSGSLYSKSIRDPSSAIVGVSSRFYQSIPASRVLRKHFPQTFGDESAIPAATSRINGKLARAHTRANYATLFGMTDILRRVMYKVTDRVSRINAFLHESRPPRHHSPRAQSGGARMRSFASLIILPLSRQRTGKLISRSGKSIGTNET